MKFNSFSKIQKRMASAQHQTKIHSGTPWIENEDRRRGRQSFCWIEVFVFLFFLENSSKIQELLKILLCWSFGLAGSDGASTSKPSCRWVFGLVSEVSDGAVGKVLIKEWQVLGPVQFPKKFLQYLSHRIFAHMHRALNVFEKITNDTV